MNKSNFHTTKVLIIGAGLSGLLTAYRLKNAGFNVKVIEARNRIGGRIHTKKTTQNTPVEMGATWFWDENIALKNLLNELNIEHFTQYMQGKAFFEAFSALPPQEVHIPSQPQSYRITGGTTHLLEKLASVLTSDELVLNQQLKSIDFSEEKVRAKTTSLTHEADAIVVTIPPALFIKDVTLNPELETSFVEIAQNTHTWMKDSIKVAVTYQYPFWKKEGFSGTVYSNVGPIMEFYDHTDAANSKFALCGFLNGGLSQFSKDEREQKVKLQLHKIFGEAGVNFISYEETLWMNEPFTALPSNQFIHAHQNNGHEVFQQPLFDGKLLLAGTETSPQSGGYMEGAVRAAERTVEKLISR